MAKHKTERNKLDKPAGEVTHVASVRLRSATRTRGGRDAIPAEMDPVLYVKALRRT